MISHFYSDKISTSPYLARDSKTLEECYYKRLGLMTELCSNSISNNFILDFLNNNSIFPIIERKISDIAKEIDPTKNSTQLKGIAN